MGTPASATAAAAIKRPKRALGIVVGIVFLDLLGFGVIIPILPFYVRSFGVSDVAIGLLAASYSIMQFLFAPLLGRLSDAHGRRPVLMLSLLGSVVAWTAFGIAGQVAIVLGLTGGLLTLFAARMFAGAMGGNIATAQAYIADITTPDRRAGALGLVGASFSLGFIFGPAVGGLLASDPVVDGAGAILPAYIPATPYSLPSFAAAGLSLLALLAAAVVLPEPERSRSPRSTTFVRQFVGAFRHATLGRLVIAFFLLSVAFSGVQVMFIPFAADVYGYGATETALLLTYVGVIGALNQGVLVGRLARRIAPARIATIGGAVLLLSLVAIPFSPLLGRTFVPLPAPELIALLLVLGLLSIGNGFLNVSLATLVSTGSGADMQGAAFGVTQGAGSLGRTVGPPIMAALYVVTYWSPFVAGAVLLLPIIAVLSAWPDDGPG